MYKLIIIATEDIRVYEFNNLGVAEQVRDLAKWANLRAEIFKDEYLVNESTTIRK